MYVGALEMNITLPCALSATGLAVLSALSFSVSANTNDDQIIVSANRFQQPVSSVLAPVTVVTREEIDKWQSNSVVDVLRRLPGVDVAQSGGIGQLSSVYIRGTEARHVMILVDGVRLNQANVSGSSDISQIPLSLVQSIEYIRGPRSAVYGSDAIGGVINILTERKTEGTTLNATMGSHGYQEYDASTQQKIGDKTTVTAAGSYLYTKGFDIEANGNTGGVPQPDRDGFMNKSLWLGVKHQLNDNFDVYARAYGFDNRTAYDSAVYDGALVDTRQLYSRTYDGGISYSEGIYSSFLNYSFNHTKDYNYDPRYGQYGKGSRLTDTEQYNVQWGNNVQVGNGSVSGGVDWLRQKMKDGSSDFEAADKDYFDNTGLYVTGQQWIGPVIAEASVRSDHHSDYGWNSTWQTNIGWEFAEGYRLIGGYGTAFKAPTLNQLYSAWGSNPNLKPEKSKQWEGGIEGNTGVLNWRATAFRNDIEELIQSESYAPWQNHNIGEAVIKGTELTGEMDTWIFHHTFSYQYIDARNGQTHERLDRRARQQLKYQLDWNIEEFDMGLTYHYIGQRTDKDYGVYDPAANGYKSVSMGGVSLFDITAAYPITDHLTIRGKVANLLDKDYETTYGYRTAGREYFLTGSYNF